MLGGNGSVGGGTGWYLVVLGQYRALLVAGVVPERLLCILG